MNINYIFYYFSVLIPILFLDGLWILFIAKKFYFKNVGFLFQKSIKYLPVFFFYPIYSFGILLLAVFPALSSNSLIECFWRGALLGLCSYGAYDLTNHATIKDWPTIMTIVDIAWGVFVSSLSSVIAYLIINFFKKYL